MAERVEDRERERREKRETDGDGLVGSVAVRQFESLRDAWLFRRSGGVEGFGRWSGWETHWQ